jgi:release factor glutamine methyltransferase
VKRLDLYLRFDRALSAEEQQRVRPLVMERGRGVPVAYLTGEREFHSLSFAVGPAVLVPRPETEHLVEVLLEALGGVAEPVFADVGTGSGCVAITALSRMPAARAHALDLSPAALDVARTNAQRHGVAQRVEFHEGDLLAPLASSPDFGRLAAVVSNPPYVVRGDPTLAPDVAQHEPAMALYVDGADPLAVALRLADEARAALAAGGLLAFEVGAGSAPEGCRRIAALGYGDVRCVKDLAGIERVVLGRRA